MSTPCRSSGFTDPHELLPSRFSHWFEIVALIVVLAGDAVAFQMIVAVAMPHSSTTVTWTLILALSAAATITMHLSGVAARRRRGGADEAGVVWRALVVACWLFLGGTAFFFRLRDAAATQQPTGSGSIFGAAAPTGSATALPLAMLMLGLYLVGGLTAYGIGYGMHNPAKAAYLRAQRDYRRALRSHRWATWRRRRALAKLASPASGMVALRILRLATPRTTLAHRRPLTTAAAVRPDPVTDHGMDVVIDAPAVDAAVTPVDELAVRRQLVLDRAQAQADQLREFARHRLAAALAEPARTSGVFDGQPHPSEHAATTTTPGDQA